MMYSCSHSQNPHQRFNVVSTLDDTYKNGIFKLNVDVTNHTAANKEVTVAYELLDAAKKVVAEGNTPLSCYSGRAEEYLF